MTRMMIILKVGEGRVEEGTVSFETGTSVLPRLSVSKDNAFGRGGARCAAFWNKGVPFLPLD